MIGSSKSVWGFDPRSVPGCSLWLDAADSSTIVLSGSNITTWVDKSGNGRNATSQGTGAVYSNNGLLFTGSQTLLGSNATYLHNSVNGTWTVFGVFQASTTSIANPRILNYQATPDNVAQFLYIENGRFSSYIWSSPSAQLTGSIVALNTPYLTSIVNTTSNTILYLNGTSNAAVNHGTNTTISNSTYWIGGFDSGSERFYGTLNELLVFSNNLSESQRQQVEGYLAHKWGLQTSIPSTHPFYSIRPHLRAFQPIDVPGCALWLDAADSTTITFSSGSNVNQWSDKSGNGRNATVYNGTPTYTVSSGMTFNGSSTLQVSYPASPAVETLFVIIKFNSVSSQSDIFAGTSTGQREFLMYSPYSPGTMYLGRYGSAPSGSINGGTVTTGTTYMLEYIFNGTGNTISFYQSGTVTSSGTPQFTYGAGGTITLIGSYGGGGFLQGQIYEILVYNTALTTSQRQQVEGYLAHKWGLSPSLPVISPLSIPGCQLWLDGADQSSMTLSGSSITQLRDKSGNGNHMVNNGTSPLYNSSLINSVGGIDCTNGGALISSEIQNSANISFAMVAVVKSGIRNWGSFFTHGDRDYDFAVERQENTSSINFQTANDNSSCIITFTVDAPVLYFGTMTSGRSRFFESFSGGVNTIVTGTNPFTISLGSKIIRVGKSDNNNEPCNSFIGEIIYYNTVLTTIQRQQIEGYLARKWGISISATLPSPHSFKSFPPASLPFSPRNISGLALWLDGADPAGTGLVPSSGSTITTWYDKSGTVNHGTSGSATFQTDSLGGYINFTGSQSYIITNPNIVVNQYFTIFVVEQLQNFSSANFGQYAFLGGSTIGNNQNLHFRYGGSGSAGDITATSGRFGFTFNDLTFSSNVSSFTTNEAQPTRVWTASFTENSRVVYLFSVNTGSDTNNTQLSEWVGGAIGRAFGGQYYNGKMREVMIYSGTITTLQRQQIEGYLAQKWGLTASLPSTHPFKKLPA